MPAPSTRHIEVLLAVTPPPAAPVNTVAPVVTGTRVVGQTLSTTDGTWTGATASRTYQWQRSGLGNIVGETASSYVLTSADAGHTVWCAVTAVNSVGTPTTANSNVISVIADIVSADIQFWKAAASGLGGSPLAQATPTTVFDSVLNDEMVSGDIEYRAVYVKNTHPVRSLSGTVVWVSPQTTSPTTDIAIGVAPQAAGADVSAISNESTAPADVTFSAPADQANGLSIGTLAPGQARGLWLRRTVLAGTVALAVDTCTLAGFGTPS